MSDDHVLTRYAARIAQLEECLHDIKLRADSDAMCEELEDAQADLRYIHARAKAALRPSGNSK